MNIIEKNLANVIYKQTYMTVTTLLLRQIYVYREPDKSFRVEFEGGLHEYYADPKNVLTALGEEEDIIRVEVTFPSLNERILIYGD